MSFKRSIILIIPISFILIFLVSATNAARFTVTPRIASSWQTDSNFYRAETGERDVNTTLIQPGIDLGFETPKSSISLNYTLNAYYYDDRHALLAGQRDADQEDYVGHTAVFQSRYRILDRLLLALDDSYYKTRDPAQSDYLSNSVARDKYFINRLTPMLFYDFGTKFTAGLRYQNTEINYSDGQNEDASENRGMFDLIYNLTSTASLDLEYQHWERDYDKTTSDYTSDQAMLIFRKQLNYTIVEVGGGYHQRDFDAPGLDKIDTVTYLVAVRFQNPPAEDPRSKSYLDLSSPYSRLKSYLDLSAEMNFNDQGIGDSYYTAHRFSLYAGHIFFRRVKVDVGGYYQMADYERETGLTPGGATELREDDTYFVKAGIGYIITDWLTFSVSASYEDRDSNLQGYDYDNRTIMAELAFSYDLGSR